MKKTLLFISLLAVNVSAYSIQPLVRNFTRVDYKSGAQNWAIVQDKSNTMYFANNSGMLEFDGKNWTTYPIDNGTNVRSLLYGNDGKFYASSFNEFGFYEQLPTGQFKYHSLLSKLTDKKLNSNELFYIHQGDKKVYFQGDNSVLVYTAGKLKNYPFNGRIDASACINNVLIVTNSEKGAFMMTGNLFVRLSGSDVLINKKICSILPYGKNKILFVTNFDGVFVFDGSTISPFNTGIDDFLKLNQVFCATTNGREIVYGTVQRGIAVQNISDKTVIFVNTYSGLQNNTVLSVAFDNQQNLWLGLDKGIDYVLLNSPIRNLFGTNNLYGTGYTSLLKENTLYFGTNQGLYTSPAPLSNSPTPLQLKLMNGMEGQIWCLNNIDNQIFCGTDRGAFMISPDQRIKQIEQLPGTWVFKKLKNHPDFIIGCSYHGLFILKKIGNNWQFSHFLKGGFSESSPMFEEDEDGTIWFSHWQKGLYRLHFDQNLDSITKIDVFDTSKGFPSNRNNTVFRIGNELIFSSEKGFYSYNKKTDKMEEYTKWNKLFANTPSYMRLHESPNGDIWCISGQFVGVIKKNANNNYQIDSLTYHILQPKISAGFEHFNFLDNYNQLLNTEDGFCWINTKRRVIKNDSFKVFLHKVAITNDKNSLVTRREYSASNDSIIKFSHEHNSIRFEFIAPEYRNADLVQYSYKLENYDDDWSDYNEDNIKEYTQLPKGDYVFRVKAKDMLESKEATYSYTFTILPAWYESQLAYILYFILFIIMIFLLIIWINERSRKGAVEMEKQKELELKEQKKQYEAETTEKKKEIKELKNQQLQYELRHKSQELASSTMNLIRKNEMLQEIIDDISKVSGELKKNTNITSVLSQLNKMEKSIKQNIEQDDNWKRFEENFDLVYENYLKRLSDAYPSLNVSDKKLCAYLKMDLTSKDIAQLMNMTLRSVEMNRYRLRKKLDLDRDVNLGEYLQSF